ncbi:hypothetical protein DRO02_03150 [archaeon]|nr:MAG: hypothetical protein DRO02_03150 [archaeon]
MHEVRVLRIYPDPNIEGLNIYEMKGENVSIHMELPSSIPVDIKEGDTVKVELTKNERIPENAILSLKGYVYSCDESRKEICISVDGLRLKVTGESIKVKRLDKLYFNVIKE